MHSRRGKKLSERKLGESEKTEPASESLADGHAHGREETQEAEEVSIA